MKRALTTILLFVAAAAMAQVQPSPELTAIQDNSFLLEEAYNQEDGVVQHIGFFMRERGSGDWVFAFTQEWPVGGQAHQFSYTAPVQGNHATGAGDVALNYRYQFRGTGDSPLAISPRVSVVLPTGDELEGFGRGSTGVQFNLPVSKVYARRIVGHTNAGAAWFEDGYDLNLGHSFIYAASRSFHLMTEVSWTRTEIDDVAETDFVVSPGFRFALNFKSGLQVVPGIAFPIGVGASSGDNSFLAYVSFEHPFGAR